METKSNLNYDVFGKALLSIHHHQQSGPFGYCWDNMAVTCVWWEVPTCQDELNVYSLSGAGSV